MSNNVLFESKKVTYYSWRDTVISGNCCISNDGNTTATVMLELFSSFHSAIVSSKQDAVYRAYQY